MLATSGEFGWISKGPDDLLTVGEVLDLYREGAAVGKVEVVEVKERNAKVKLIEGEAIAVLDEVRRPQGPPPQAQPLPEPEEPPVPETPLVEEPAQEPAEATRTHPLPPGEDPSGLLEGYGYVYTPRALLGAPGWAGSLTFVSPSEPAGFDCRAAASVGFSYQARGLVAGARWQSGQECRTTARIDKREWLRAHVKLLSPSGEKGKGSTIGALLALEQEKQESDTADGGARTATKISSMGFLWGWQAKRFEASTFALWEHGIGAAAGDTSGDLSLGASLKLLLREYFDLIAEYRGGSDVRPQAWAAGFRLRLARELSLFGLRAQEGSSGHQIVAGFSLPL